MLDSVIHYGSFLRGTPITKIDGQEVRIEEIKRGDLLRGIGPNGESNTSQVLVIARDFCPSYIKITTEDTELNVSGKHRIYVGPDVPSDAECPHFVKANTLQVNDYLYFRNEKVKKSKIIDITEIHEKTEVFNLKCDRPGVAATHDDEDCWATFHAAGIAVHEMGACAPIGITHIIPNCGPPGTLVTIIARDDGAVHAYEGFDGFFGDNVCGCAIFCNPGYVTGVTFGGNPAVVLGSSRFICHAIAPQGSGTVTIAATTDWSGGTVAFAPGSNEFTYSDFCGYGWRLSPPHQKHSTGSTNDSIPHDKPINKWTTGKGIGMRRKWLLAASIIEASVPSVDICLHHGPQELFLSDGNWTAPAGVYWIYAECQGGGSSGDGGAGDGGTGGGGGGYGAGLVPVIPGNNYTIIVGGPGMSSDFANVIYGFGGGVPDGGSGVGDVVIDGSDGIIPGSDFGGDGGAAAVGGSGGAGGTDDPGPGSPGSFPGGGGGGGGTDGESGQDGGAGTSGFVRFAIVYSVFGINNDTHQTNTSGQTNYSIMHCQPLNDTTTTKGIGMRRKWILASGFEPPAVDTGITYINIRACYCPPYVPE